jgi:outer membrane protein assembly factor BamB
MRVVDNVAYLGTYDRTVYALRAADGRLLWRFQTAGSSDFKPLVANGVVYTAASVGEQEGYIYALRASDGHQLWQYKTGGSPDLVMNDGSVYVTSRTGLAVLQADSGYVLWRYAPAQLIDYLQAQIGDGVVYLNAQELDAPFTTTTYALQASTGKQLWRYRASYPATVALVEGGIVYLSEQGTPPEQSQVAGPGSLIALQGRTGHVLWRQVVDGTPAMVRSVAGVMYFVAEKATLEPPSTTTATGFALWSIPVLRPQIAHKGAFLSIYALRMSDGRVLWRSSLNNGKISWANWLETGGETLYVAATGITDQKGYVSALSMQNGSVVWQHGYVGSSGGAIVATQGGVLYLSVSKETASAVLALRLSDGSQLWSYPISGSLFSPPQLNGTSLYVGGDNAMAYALNARTGAYLWHYQVALN